MMGMQFTQSKKPETGRLEMSNRISAALLTQKPVLWLICGGSNIPTAAEALIEIRKSPGGKFIKNLIIAQTDERYGPVGHKDSNWKQMIDEGMDFTGITTLPILVGRSLDTTVTEYADRLKPIMDDVSKKGGLILAQFGIGSNAHIAGIYPHSVGLSDPRLVVGYDSGDYIRVTLTAAGLAKIDEAYVFAFGENKREAMNHIRNNDASVDDVPGLLLTNIPKVFLYSDVFR